MRTQVALALAASLTASTALAGGMSEPVPDPVVIDPVEPAPAWTGPYVGAQLGFGTFEQGDDSGSGVLGGIHAGYMYQFGGGAVIGAELDYVMGDIELASNSDGVFTVDSVARLKLRGGVASGQTLFYGTAGMAKAEVDKFGISNSPEGTFAGAGIGRLMGDNGMLSGEVLFHHFDDFDGAGELSGTTATVRYSFRF